MAIKGFHPLVEELNKCRAVSVYCNEIEQSKGFNNSKCLEINALQGLLTENC